MGTFLGALVGLVAVYFAHFVAEQYRGHIRGTTAAALLLGELTSYREAYELQRENFPQLLKLAEGGCLPRLPRAKLPKDLALEVVLPDVGLLGAEICCDVAYVYHNVRAFRATFQAVVDDEELDNSMKLGMLQAANDARERARERGEKLIGLLARRVRQEWALSDVQWPWRRSVHQA